MVTVETNYIFNFKKVITVKNKDIPNTIDKWIGDNNTISEKHDINYIKREFKLDGI